MSLQPDFNRLSEALAAWPKVTLAHGPTPLDALPRLSESFAGHTFHLKRDDCTGLAMGGNKARQLEYYFGDAIAEGADVVLSTGATQSNYMRCIAASAAKLGMECHIQLESRVKNVNQDYLTTGNVLLDQMFGAQIHSYDQEDDDEFGADRHLREIAAELAKAGKKSYVVPLAPVEQPKGGLGYVEAAMEMVEQMLAQDVQTDLIVVGSGSGLTHAGLLTGLRVMGVDIPVLGACVRRDAVQQKARILMTCRRIEAMLNVGGVVSEEDVWVDDRALAPGYGQASEDVMRAISLLARKEGVLVDPVYSAKTVACTMLALEAGDLKAYPNITMVHTGGTPVLFAYREQILSSSQFGL